MRKRVYLIAAVVSDALTISGCTTNPYTSEYEMGKSVIDTGLGSLVGAGTGVLSFPKKNRGKDTLIGAAAGAVLGGDVGYYTDMRKAELRDKMCGTGASVTRSGDNIILNTPNNVISDSSSATLKPVGVDILTSMATALKEYPRTAANVIGYVGNTGGHDLSTCPPQQRADPAASALIIQGVGASRICTQGPGPANLIISNSTVEGETQNRRVEITLSPS